MSLNSFSEEENGDAVINIITKNDLDVEINKSSSVEEIEKNLNDFIGNSVEIQHFELPKSVDLNRTASFPTKNNQISQIKNLRKIASKEGSSIASSPDFAKCMNINEPLKLSLKERKKDINKVDVSSLSDRASVKFINSACELKNSRNNKANKLQSFKISDRECETPVQA